MISPLNEAILELSLLGHVFRAVFPAWGDEFALYLLEGHTLMIIDDSWHLFPAYCVAGPVLRFL